MQFVGMLIIEHTLASYPGSRWVGKERAWYLLFAHALNFPEILGNRKLLCYIHTTVMTYRYIVRTFSDQGWKHFDRSFSSSLRQLGTSGMNLKKVQVPSSLDFYVFIRLLPGKSVIPHILCYHLS